MEMVRLFIEKGADVNAVMNDGETPLHRCLRFLKQDKMMNLVRILVENGAESLMSTQRRRMERLRLITCTNSTV